MPESMLNQGFVLGIVVSLVFSELLGITAGGIVVPGYLAVQVDKPLALAATMMVSFITFGFIRALSNFMFVYGHRRLVVTLLMAVIIGELVARLSKADLGGEPLGFVLLGRVIPGLIAGWMDIQGVTRTLSAMAVVIVLVALILILLSNLGLIERGGLLG